MKIGQKVTVMKPSRDWLHLWPEGEAFLRCRVLREVNNGWQLYDPIRNWSWGFDSKDAGKRVV